MARVVLENLTKKFGKATVVDRLNLEVNDGEFVALLGPPGAGKTTILRMIAGLDSQTSGNIRIGDRLVNKLQPSERNVSMVFQTFALYPQMNVYDNLAFPLKKRRMSKADIDKGVKEVGEMLGISHLLEKKPALLSGGERQRVAIGRAIVRPSDVFLLDEPLSNLDAKLRILMRVELRKLQEQLKQTALFGTPDELEAMSMADKIAVINEGKLVQFDVSETIFDHPKDLFVAKFVGSPPMNTLVGKYEQKERGKPSISFSGFTLDVSELQQHLGDERLGSELVLGVRPSNLSVSKEKSSTQRIQAEVYATEPLGSETILDLKVGEDIVKAIVPPTFPAATGDAVWLGMDTSRVHIFDKQTEVALI
jgi:multiple sugar transport system ATP-binding protein